MTVKGCILAAILAVFAGDAVLGHAAGKPVVTSKTRFRIPYRFDAAQLDRMNVRELQLHVSANRGANWELAQTILPQSGKFEYQAPADGEYWFAVRTIDGAGVAQPPGTRLQAGLIVVVDTLAPSLAVNLEQSAPGKIQLMWSASDANLDVTTLRLEYRQPGQPEWQQVSVVPTQRGMTSWSAATTGMVAVRGSISDLAGNVGQTKSEIEIRSISRPSSPDVPDLRAPIAEQPSNEHLTQSHPKTETGLPLSSFPSSPPAITPAPGRLTPGEEPKSPLVSSMQDRRPMIVQDRWPATSDAPSAIPSTNTTSRQRLVNHRRFQMAYKVDDVGPSGVGSVELFITPDRGRQWYRYGVDADRKSPFDVEVPHDGEYGFSIRVRSGAGLGIDPPVPGEAPAMEVVVDQTPPRIELLPVQQGRGPNVNELTIAWRIAEERPADNSVSLYYAPSLQGPWEALSGWRPDTGSFVWTVAAGVPPQVYIRVMARDAAGNVGQAETTRPVLVDLTRPSAHLVDVELLPTAPR